MSTGELQWGVGVFVRPASTCFLIYLPDMEIKSDRNEGRGKQSEEREKEVWIKGGNMPNPNTGRLNLGNLKFESIKKKNFFIYWILCLA